MKQIIQHGLLLAAFIMGMTLHLSAQSTLMTIQMNDGTERTYSMTENDRFYFEDNEKLVVEIAVYGRGEQSERVNLADIRKITCAETESISETSSTSVYLTPNPVHDVVSLRNLKSKEALQIYALDGRLMKSVEASEGQLIDISDLPIGLYLVKTEHQTLKMIKL